MVITKENTTVEVGFGVGVWETSERGGGGDEGVDRWVVRGVFRGVSLSKPGKLGGMNVLRCIPQCTC